MEKNTNLSWYEKYHTAIMVVLGILFLIAFIFFVKTFFKTEVKNQNGQVFIDEAGNEIKVEKETYESKGRVLNINKKEDGTVFGKYIVNGVERTFNGRYSDGKEMLYTTMEYIEDGKPIIEEVVFKIYSDGSVAEGVGEKNIGKNGVDIYEDLEKTDFNSVILKRN